MENIKDYWVAWMIEWVSPIFKGTTENFPELKKYMSLLRLKEHSKSQVGKSNIDPCTVKCRTPKTKRERNYLRENTNYLQRNNYIDSKA